MLYDFTITDTFIGQTIGPNVGFLVDLKQVRGPSRYIAPAFDEGRQHWVSGYFQIRGALDHRDLVCVCPSQSPSAPFGTYVINKSIAYRGALTVLCVPVGSEWRMTLSDVALTQRELDERAEALRRKALEDHVAAIRNPRYPPAGPGVTARRAQVMMEGATRPI
jgi:hypothetical protein